MGKSTEEEEGWERRGGEGEGESEFERPICSLGSGMFISNLTCSFLFKRGVLIA